ncbi:DUF411 domain-containing protein [Halomonas sp. V046]|uniref:DUF411 domain-containing protein n=1 Tax=Halomonas sp. V046 TaxID=3459611 RepID=UPI004044964F
MSHFSRAFVVVTGALLSPLALAASLDMHKDPNCGCCSAWAEHMRDAGFEVRIHETADIGAVKRELGVPASLGSCHTATLETDAGRRYLIEGHVPAEQVARLMEQNPDIEGLAVPGMPQGSPGMETGRVDEYAVLSWADGAERAEVFARYP